MLYLTDQVKGLTVGGMQGLGFVLEVLGGICGLVGQVGGTGYLVPFVLVIR